MFAPSTIYDMLAPSTSHAPAVRPISFRGQPALQLQLPSGDVAVVALQGAQVVSWVTADGAERLYLSPCSVFDGHTAIRGGVPVCFPQFNQRGPLAKHGFARNLPWRVVDEGPADSGAAARTVLALDDLEQTRSWWSHRFAARLAVELRPGGLRIELAVQNTGSTAWDFTAALHSYLSVQDIAQVQLRGLQGCARWDAVADVRDVQAGPVGFVGEYDSVFAAAAGPLRIDGGVGPVLGLRQSANWGNTVVWNPGAALSERLADMPGDGYRHMLCVEAAAVDHPVTLAPGERWTGWQDLESLP